ncbi:ribokinase [uncultured Anaerococcus sp.]|uniref:ribokinase n=1 Tax=uncultured Anaerococcus sp. TaxID=293428 RepID=UPI00261FF115|nr:ribokinase [uncultured Anaerococcus sp.]
MKQGVKILNFGSLNIDKIYSLDHIVNEGETISAMAYKEGVGGKGLNQSVAIKRAGASLFHAGCVGKVDGKLLINYLKDNAIESFLKESPGNSGHAIIQVDKKANNSIIVEAGANKEIDPSYIDEVLEKFNPGDYLLLQNEISNLPYIVAMARQKKMSIFFNPSPIDESIYDIDLNDIGTIIINETEGHRLSGYKTSFEILNYFKKVYPHLTVVLTLGSRGGIYADKDKEIRFKSYPVDPVDTTGAGDTFLGYYLANIARGKDIEYSLNIASLAAALACSKEGAASSIPSQEEVEAYIKANDMELEWIR